MKILYFARLRQIIGRGQDDISVPADQALYVARIMALKKSVTTLANPDRKAAVEEEIKKLESELAAMKAKTD